MTKGFLLLALGCGVSAFPTSATASAPVGPRVEALVGYDNMDGDDVGSSFQGDTNPDGVFFGVGLGYDFAVGSVALGIDAELTESTSAVEISIPSTTFSSKVGLDAYVGGRLSFGVSEAANVYIKGGVTNVWVDHTLDTTLPIMPGQWPNNSAEAGYRIGVGGQFAVGGKSYVGAEYRMSDYGEDGNRHQLGLILGTRF